MKLSDFIKKHGDCEVTEEMEKYIKPKKKGKWMPVAGERYWYVTSYGSVYSDTWSRHYADEYRIDFLRIFKTEKEAERYLEIQKACKKASFEPDWENDDQRKFYLVYDYRTNSVTTDTGWSVKLTNCYYFESEYEELVLINKFGEKDIVKYVLGVEVE